MINSAGVAVLQTDRADVGLMSSAGLVARGASSIAISGTPGSSGCGLSENISSVLIFLPSMKSGLAAFRLAQP